MSMETVKPTLGPTLISTLCTNDAESCIAAYCEHLNQRIHSTYIMSQAEAQHLGCDNLTGCTVTYLANELDEPWLRIIESEHCEVVAPFKHYGWLSLEICVADVDSLRPQLTDTPFEIIGEPANLDISDDIRAMQVIGPAGEVLYLTEIKSQVPGFELPMARCAVDKLFIPVALVNSREEAKAHYENFPGVTSMQFDTKITVINRANDLPITQKHPIATVQLAGCNLIELDEFAGLLPNLRSSEQLHPGISLISMAVDELPAGAEVYVKEHGPYVGCESCVVGRDGGEVVELVLRK